MDSHHAGGTSGDGNGGSSKSSSSSKLPVKGSAQHKAPSSAAPRPSSDGPSVGDGVKGRARAAAEGGREGGRGGAGEGGRVGRGGSGRGEGEGSIEGVSKSSLQKDADDGRVLRNAEGAAGEGEGPEGESELLLPLEQRNGLMVLRLRSHGSIAGPAFGFPGLGAVQEVTVGAPGDDLEGRF